uniref:Uncharacterized protein n=1 Tax=Panagrolaimus sp. JU765 TaxID=591449 RepID=A0AC34RL42_9BILA
MKNANALGFQILVCIYDNFIAVEFLVIPWTFVPIIKTGRFSSVQDSNPTILIDPGQQTDFYFRQLQQQWN